MTTNVFNPDAIEWPKGFIRGRVVMQIARALFEDGPMCNHELVNSVGSHRAVVSKATYRLREIKKVYISGWTHPGEGNNLAPVWAWRTHPNQRDAKRPAPKTRTEINMTWNAKNAAIRNAKQRAQRGSQLGMWAGLIRGNNNASV